MKLPHQALLLQEQQPKQAQHTLLLLLQHLLERQVHLLLLWHQKPVQHIKQQLLQQWRLRQQRDTELAVQNLEPRFMELEAPSYDI